MMYRCEQCASDAEKVHWYRHCLEVGGIAAPPLGIWAAWGECFTSSRTARGRQDMDVLRPSLLSQKKNHFRIKMAFKTIR